MTIWINDKTLFNDTWMAVTDSWSQHHDIRDESVHSKCLHFTTSLCKTPHTKTHNSTHHKAHTQCHKFPTSTSIAHGGNHTQKKQRKERQTRILRRQTQKKGRLNDKEQENRENDDKRPHILIVAPDPMKLCYKWLRRWMIPVKKTAFHLTIERTHTMRMSHFYARKKAVPNRKEVLTQEK